MARFHEHARSRLGTPSAGQVTRPPTRVPSPAGAYAFATDPIHAMLADDIAAFGYAEAAPDPDHNPDPPSGTEETTP